MSGFGNLDDVLGSSNVNPIEQELLNVIEIH